VIARSEQSTHCHTGMLCSHHPQPQCPKVPACGVAQALKELASHQQISLAQALSGAIGTETYLLTKQRNGEKVLIENGGAFEEVIFSRSRAA
jgi:hypothetical protein